MTISLLAPPVPDPPTDAMRGAYVEAAAVLDEVVDAQTHDLGDADLVALLDEVERVGRLADSARIHLAAEVVVRCENPRGIEPLCREYGCRNPNDLLTRATGIASREASRRMRLGRNIVETRDVLGTARARYPDVALAMRRGRLGVDAAEQITAALDPTFRCTEPEAIGMAERALVASATGEVTEETAGTPNAGIRFASDHIRAQSALWRARLDPDGAAPDEPTRVGHSSLGFGRLRDGLYPLRGAVTPDLRGVMDALFNSYLSARSRPAFRDAAGPGRGGTGSPEVGGTGSPEGGATAATHDRIDDMRTTDEKRADILHGLLDWAARQSEAPTMAGSAPTVLVHVNAADLDAGIGVGWVDGLEPAVSLTTVRQLMCNDGFETVVKDHTGAVLRFGTARRTFSRAQRRAMAARDGGCVIPGCSTPAQWTEAHHVIPWRDGGRTDIDNGVLLCWFHHHEIDRSGWRIRMVRGRPEIQSPAWLDRAGTWRPGGQNRAGRPIGRGLNNSRPRQAGAAG